LEIKEKALGSHHLRVATALSNLALVYEAQSRYSDAEPPYKRALAIEEAVGGPDHLDVAFLLNNLAELHRDQGRDSEAEPLYKRSLQIKEKALGPDHSSVAGSLNNLALVYDSQGRYGEAEPLYKRSLLIKEKAFGPDHPDVARTLNNLAILYKHQSRYAEAEPLFKRSLAMREKALGDGHPDAAASLNNLAELYRIQGRYADALPIVQRTISQNSSNKSVAFAVLYGSTSQALISPTQALNASYTVLQRSVSSAAGEAVSKLAARFAVGNNELAQLVRKDQDLTAESNRLDKSIIAAISKPSAERNASAEEQIRKRIDEIKSERDNLQDVFNQRFPDYVALSKPQPLTKSSRYRRCLPMMKRWSPSI
jgi:tetratricopeptide (TPR) repeat protein